VTRLGKLLRTTVFKLSLAYLVLTALMTAVLLGVLAYRTNAIFGEQVSSGIGEEMDALLTLFEEEGIRGVVDGVDRRIQRPGAHIFLVTTPAGEPIRGNILRPEPGVLDRAGTRRIVYTRDDEDDGRSRFREAIVTVRILGGNWRLLVGRDLEDQARFGVIVQQTVLIAAVAVLVLGIGGGWFVASRVLRRVDEVGDTSRSIMGGDLSRRLPVTGTEDEFDRLSESVNAMLGRIEQLMHGLKDVSDNIAHDLKTPLTRLRTRTEAALRAAATPEELRQTLERTLEDTDGLIRTFDALLMIARTESGAGSESFVEVDLSAVAETVVDLYGAAAEERGLWLALVPGDRVIVRGNRELLAQAIANLVDNALKHAGGEGEAAPAPERAAVNVAVRREADRAVVTVIDRGPGIPPEARARVLDRFVRLEQSRSVPGAGLGLSLVQAIAGLHGGTLRLEDAAPGLRVVLTLP